MKTKILLPTDFSDNAWSAIVYALKLYANESCVFYFLNTIDNEALHRRSLVTGHFLEELKQEATKNLLELKEQASVSNANENHEFEVVLCSEKIEVAIKKNIEKHHINMVIMGTKGASKNEKVLFGSNTVHVLNKVKTCPIMVVPDEFDFVKPTQIAFPTDYNRFYKGEEIQVLRNLTELYNSKIRIVHIEEEKELNQVQRYNINELDEYLNQVEHSFHWMPNYAKKATVINDFIEELNINILVMVNYKHSFIESIINEPVLKKISFHPIIPFLVIPE
ncbi:universal stress protein [Lacinutrix sp. WUR7]|uniref:universal stress protein n=1 Tax=Lacinutrix sp. WUR7 TaxID=2653681 RepID=UPI00193DD0FF|nr:universal stress protein [Lacinutrix sp. WUR7]QRM89362.1 universal stress protein [Lacinutrix sp. WUR7]